jgi:hypothetical protein
MHGEWSWSPWQNPNYNRCGQRSPTRMVYTKVFLLSFPLFINKISSLEAVIVCLFHSLAMTVFQVITDLLCRGRLVIHKNQAWHAWFHAWLSKIALICSMQQHVLWIYSKYNYTGLLRSLQFKVFEGYQQKSLHFDSVNFQTLTLTVATAWEY